MEGGGERERDDGDESAMWVRGENDERGRVVRRERSEQRDEPLTSGRSTADAGRARRRQRGLHNQWAGLAWLTGSASERAREACVLRPASRAGRPSGEEGGRASEGAKAQETKFELSESGAYYAMRCDAMAWPGKTRRRISARAGMLLKQSLVSILILDVTQCQSLV